MVSDGVNGISAICSTLAGSYPGPRVTIRFRLLHQLRQVRRKGAGRRRGVGDIILLSPLTNDISVYRCLSLSVLNCDFGQMDLTETVVGCTGSDITVQGCYMQGIQVGDKQRLDKYDKLQLDVR